MRPMLMGVETEFAFTPVDKAGRVLNRGRYLSKLLNLVHQEWPHLRGQRGGDVFLGNGARLYIDCGAHPEFSTPECSSPHETLTYVRAGEEMLAVAARELERSEEQVAHAWLFKCNVDYHNTMSTWGSHESYLHQRPPVPTFPTNLNAHFASRIIYTGAGGLKPRSPGIEFTLSPRVTHLVREVSGMSTEERGLYHTKDETLSQSGYHRLHVLCGESLCSHTADYLRIGTTALIVALIDAGLRPGQRVRFDDPLDAMRQFAADPTCTVTARMKDATHASAIEVQRHYLQQVERHLDAEFMPEWAGDVCKKWCDVLDGLERDPMSMATTLDWPLKLTLFRKRASQQRIEWDAMDRWTRMAHRVKTLPAPGSDQAFLKLGAGLMPEAKSLNATTKKTGVTVDEGLARFLTLRAELCEMDTRFGQLGGSGIFSAVDDGGGLHHRMAHPTEIEVAKHVGPTVGRARVRSIRIRELASRPTDYSCSWQGVVDKKKRLVLDLSHPFEATPQWSPL